MYLFNWFINDLFHFLCNYSFSQEGSSGTKLKMKLVSRSSHCGCCYDNGTISVGLEIDDMVCLKKGFRGPPTLHIFCTSRNIQTPQSLTFNNPPSTTGKSHFPHFMAPFYSSVFLDHKSPNQAVDCLSFCLYLQKEIFFIKPR